MNRRLLLRRAGMGTAGLALAQAASSAQWKGSPPKRFLEELPRWMQVAPVPGVWITWLERGKVGWQQGFGVRNAATRRPVDADTIFEAASLTKQITAYVAHELRSEGKLDFDQPLNRYVGDRADPAAQGITARHVLSHCSGLPNWRSKPGEPLRPEFPPGQAYRYSGEGYVYLSRALENITGRAYGELVEERVFGPLGMSGSSVFRRQDREERMATGHDRRGNVLPLDGKQRFWSIASAAEKPVAAWRYDDAGDALTKAGLPAIPNNLTPNAAASICTTGPDYAKFVLRAVRNPALHELHTVIRHGTGWRFGFGLGWGVEQTAGRTFLWQWGDNGGYKNFVAVDPVAQTGVFVFTNGDSGLRICDRVAAHANGVEHAAFFWLS